MKIFSAQNTDHKEFSLIEFRTELDALPLLNDLPSDVKVVDMFSLLNGHFVVFISCNNLKNVYEKLSSSVQTVGGYFTNDTIIECLKAFYYLNKPSISDSVIVLETDKFYKLFEVMHKSILAGLQVLDIKNQRSFSKNTIYLTGKVDLAEKFSKELSQSKDTKSVFMKSVSETFKNNF